jgi:hypothetical protein
MEYKQLKVRVRGTRTVSECNNAQHITHQTSCLRPATLAAGLKGSLTIFAAASPLNPMTLLLRRYPVIARGRRAVVVVNSLFSIARRIDGGVIGRQRRAFLLRERDLCQSRHKPRMARSAGYRQDPLNNQMRLLSKFANSIGMEPLTVKIIWKLVCQIHFVIYSPH